VTEIASEQLGAGSDCDEAGTSEEHKRATSAVELSLPFGTVLIANRGEIAVRIIRTLRNLGLRSVAVFSDADADARHVHEADVAFRLGPAPAAASYLNVDRLLAACVATGAEAVHPGYGFLSENAGFAATLEERGIVFVGPPARAIAVMGDKITAKNTVVTSGVPVVPGVARPGMSDAELREAAEQVGYPVLIKPSAGGGGKGMRVVTRAADLQAALDSARRESRSAFGNDTLFVERFVATPRHIEVQVLADAHGNVVHLGERECSLQRRHQKVIEEAPSPLLDEATRRRIGAAACATARSVDYRGAGTVEFIVSADAPDEFFFMEMNTRLQVEHPVTEMTTGVDLVEWQLRIAGGEKLTLDQSSIRFDGHAIEARVYAEDPDRGFLPTGGRIRYLSDPRGPGVRVDSGIGRGFVVGSDYDPMLAKVIAHGADRAQALARLDAALANTVVLGVTTNVAFLRELLADPQVRAGALDTGLLDRIVTDRQPPATPTEVLLAAAAFDWPAAVEHPSDAGPWETLVGWRLGDPAVHRVRLEHPAGPTTVELTGPPAAATATVHPKDGAALDPVPFSCARAPGGVVVVLDGVRRMHRLVPTADGWWVHDADGITHLVRRARHERLRDAGAGAAATEITSPMPGTVLALLVADGAAVVRGESVLVVEAMKMEHTLAAEADGVVELLARVGEPVRLDQVLARIGPAVVDEGSAG
jgi:acetyl-CoA/propionyl-CoA carboxylase biotin carboxyl carrier protein